MRAPVKRRSPLKIIALAVGALLLGTFGTLGILYAMGVPLPFLQKPILVRQREGIPVPIAAKPIPAYTKLTKEYFINPRTGDYAVDYVPSKEHADRLGLMTSLKDLLGRVTTREKNPGYGFTEKDLFPVGTRAGVVAGIPPGKRAFVIQGDKIQGIHALKAGDRFDLLGSVSVDMDKAMAKLKQAGVNNSPLLNDSLVSPPKRASMRVLVENGAIVVPTAIREVPTGASANVKGKIPTKPLQEITLAVDPQEVPYLTEALAVNLQMVCVARSGHPEETLTERSKIVIEDNAPRMQTIETIVGNKRQVLVFTKPGEAPQVLPEPRDPIAQEAQ